MSTQGRLRAILRGTIQVYIYRRKQPHFGPPGCGPVRQGASHRKPGWMQEECWPRYPT